MNCKILYKKGEVLSMESKKEMVGKNERNLIEEWEKPSVKELDINSITQSGTTGTGADGGIYS
jgi:hypothetical protein